MFRSLAPDTDRVSRSDPDDAPRRLRLAVEDPALREELAALLRREHIEVEFAPSLGEGPPPEADVVVVRPPELGAGDEEDGGDAAAALLGAEEKDAPGVIVLAEEGGEPTEEARLVAAGALAVLDGSAADARLREQIVELTEAEAGGGLDGPEAGGAQAEPKLADFQSRSPRMRDFLDVVRRIADSDSTLLITGETGVGKERLARAVHAASARAAGPFVAVNCGALPENLLESELFGHERGAFTGADATRRGRFEEAEGGTILLDEIGEMPPHLQVKLLTVLQRREVRRLGSEEPRSVDVRVLSATNRDLAEDVAAGRFREDLLFRLNVVALAVPPLRERREDLPQLLGRFLRHFVGVHDRPDVQGFDREAMEALLRYDWPGNVREVVNVVERAVLLCEGERIRRADLPEAVWAGPGSRSGEDAAEGVDDELWDLPLQEARRRLVEGFERRYLVHHLEATRGVVGETAARAGINPRTLYEKMRRYGLAKRDFR